MYGPNTFLVRINVQLSDPVYKVRHTGQSKIKKRSNNTYDILPGYPVLKNLGNQNTPYDSETIFVKPAIKKVLVRLLVKKGTPSGQITRAKELITTIISVEPKKITLQTETKEFFQTEAQQQTITITKIAKKWFSFQNILFLLALLLLYMFYQSYEKNSDLQRAAIAAMKSDSGSGSNGGGSGGVQRVVMSGKSGGDKASSSVTMNKNAIKKYFDFVTDDNLDNFVHILKKENMSVENIAVITSFLHPDLGAKVIMTLDLNQQATIAINMLNQKTVNRQNIEKLEIHIKNALECLIGGKGHFHKTFMQVPSDVKKKLLVVLGKANPDAYKSFRTNIIIFDDLKLLSNDEVKILLSDTHMESLSKALANADKQVYQRFFDNMTLDTKDMFKQTLELKGKTYSQKEIEESQEEILKLVYELESDTLFNLSERIKV